MPYGDYLQTPEWRRTRDRALRRVGWRCERCPATRALQVHHRTYARLGAELDTDLEVLCQTCHEGHHFDEGRREFVDVFVKLVSEALKDDTFHSAADLSEAVKARCAVLRIAYDGDRVARAIRFLETKRRQFITAAPRAFVSTPAKDATPYSRTEADAFCRRLGFVVAFRGMPAVTWSDPQAEARALAARQSLDEDLS